jgi:hypothetical protein
MGVFSSFWSASETVAGETQMEAARRRTLIAGAAKHRARRWALASSGKKTDSLNVRQNVGCHLGIAAPDPSSPSGGVSDMP